VIVGILEDLVVEEDLVGFAEAELQLVLVEQLFVSLAPSQYIPYVEINKSSCIPSRASTSLRRCVFETEFAGRNLVAAKSS
jgi:uncharacterized protein (DUF427 family)